LDRKANHKEEQIKLESNIRLDVEHHDELKIKARSESKSKISFESTQGRTSAHSLCSFSKKPFFKMSKLRLPRFLDNEITAESPALLESPVTQFGCPPSIG
jgi:hypothetical protein